MQRLLVAEPEIDWEAKERAALAIIDQAVAEFGPKAVVAAFSGGIDSAVTARIASKHPACRDALLIDTQTGVPEGHAWVADRCAEWGLNLRVMQSHVDFMDTVRQYGILGPAHHKTYFNALKGRVFRQIGYDLAPATTDRILLVSGARRQESAKRKKNVIPIRHDRWEQRLVWVAPIHDWSALECRLYLRGEGIEPNPVSQLLHRSGECNCPAFMDKPQIEELRLWYPETAALLDEASHVAKEAGKWHVYGEPVPAWFDRQEPTLEGFVCEPEACNDCPMRTTEDGGRLDS